MRIGIDCRMYRREIAGIGTYLRNLIFHLAEIDQENEYVLFMTPQDAEEFQVDSGQWTVDRSKFNIQHSKFKIVIVDIHHYSLKEQTKFGRIVESENLDLIHYPNFNHPLLCKTPFVATIHDLIYLHFPGRAMNSPLHRFLYRRLNKHIAKRAKKIIAVSEHTRQDFLENFPCDLEKVEVVYEAALFDRDPTSPTSLRNKLDDNAFDTHRGRISTPRSRTSLNSTLDTQSALSLSKGHSTLPIFLYVGAWRPHKNLVFLIEAFDQVVQEIPKAKLVIVGKVDPAFPEISAKVKELKLEQNVLFTDFVAEQKELERLYQMATAFVFPSLYEGFGLPPLEAAARGVPVICSNRTSLPEVMGEAALFVDPENREAWSEAMLRIVRDEKLRSVLIKKGLVQVEKYSWKKAAKQTLEIYQKAFLQ